MMGEHARLSVVVPISERYDEIEATYRAYKRGAEGTGMSFEFIYVLDGDYPEVLETLKRLSDGGEPIDVITLAKWFGEATALAIGFSHASGEVILTLPAYLQIKAVEIPRLVAALEDYDMIVARRHPRVDARTNVLQSSLFHFIMGWLVDTRFHDLGCGVRVLRREVADELNIYGDQHRFLPLLAHGAGFKVREVDAAQAEEDAHRRLYGPGVYVRRLLDIMAVTFIVKFTKKPLRFFGMIGSLLFAIGSLGILYLAFERIFLGVALADRPAFVLAVLVLVLGVQTVAVGLIGELIIFTHAKELKEYRVEKVVGR